MHRGVRPSQNPSSSAHQLVDLDKDVFRGIVMFEGVAAVLLDGLEDDIVASRKILGAGRAELTQDAELCWGEEVTFHVEA